MNHLAVVRKPFLDLILEGKKTIDSRWTQNRTAPFWKVKRGDTIYFKETGKPACATANVAEVRFMKVTPDIAEKIRIKFGKELCADMFDNWEDLRHMNFVTLVFLRDVKPIEPLRISCYSRNGWVCLKPSDLISAPIASISPAKALS